MAIGVRSKSESNDGKLMKKNKITISVCLHLN